MEHFRSENVSRRRTERETAAIPEQMRVFCCYPGVATVSCYLQLQ